MSFHFRAKAGLTLLLALLVVSGGAGAQNSTRLLRQPDISAHDVVFIYGGDVWMVSRSGGLARRLTANPSIKRFPKFSPDGKFIAFTGNYDGNNDVYVIPAEGGEPKRLTYHPYADDVLGWTPDGRSVLFRSRRASFMGRFSKLFTVPLTGGLEKELPLPEGGLASFSPDGSKIAYNRIEREFATWKRYRGGWQSYVSVYDLKNNAYSELPHSGATDFYPMWKGEKIYFASDRTNTVNLFAYDLKTKGVKQLTHFSDYDVKWPSLGPDAIVFEQGGLLHIFDLKTEKETPISVQANSDLAVTRPTIRHVEGSIAAANISPSGARAIFEARGELFTVPAKKGETRNLTNTPGIREINPNWSPDGKTIAYFSDRTGEYELTLRSQDGTGTETRLTTDGGVYRNGLNWSPDSKALLYTDVAMRLWMITVADKKPVLIDSSKIGQISLGRWSPDSKWIAYTRPNANNNSSIVLYSIEQQKGYELGDKRWDDANPVFDHNGKYLYFTSDRTFTPSMIGPETNITFQNMTGLYALVLQADTPSPLGPESDEEKPKEEKAEGEKGKAEGEKGKKGEGEKPVKIDLDGLYGRIVALPPPPGNYHDLNAGNGKLFYMTSGPQGGPGALHQFDLAGRNDVTILNGIQGYDLTPSATKVGYLAGKVYGIVDVAPNIAVGTGSLNLSLEMRSDPRAEWKQIFWEAWRFERDFYYDPNMKGLDWKGIGERYAKLLPSVSHRDDLTYLISELAGELNTSHAYVQGAENPEVKQIGVGLLGVDFEADNGYYRFKKIYPGENWEPARRSPLTEPGLKVKQGDYLIAVNGVPLKTDTNPYALFEDTVGKTVTLRVNSQPSEVGAHDIQARPIDNDMPLRYLDWVDGCRKRVEAATGGRVGYVHVPNTSTEGMSEFGKGFYSLTDKDALIVDERYNGGGFIPDFFVEKLGRRLLSIASQRYGQDFKSPGGAVYGPKVILANEWAGSGGDAFPYYFRKAGVGPIIGKRTWGGLVGINGNKTLMDGGSVTVPQFGIWSPQDGKWIAENYGVEPDIEVNNTPDLVNQGHDPQLERAIAYILDQLKKNPPPKYQHPPFPVERLTPIERVSQDTK